MESNNLFDKRYFFERLLGRGNFSEVWLAKDEETNTQVALKIYAPATGLDDHGMNVLSREFAILVDANQKNLLIPKYYASYERKPYLVLKYCKRGSILKQVGQFSEDDAWHLLHDVAAGLAYLHDMNPPLIHQDIKPDNIMINDDGTYMITDFGVSAHAKSVLRKSTSTAFASAGTTAYMAPERFSKDNSPIKASDIWSLGAMVYEMLTGDVPFTTGGASLEGGILQKNGVEIPDLPGQFSQQLNHIIHLCLKEEPWDRPTAEQVVDLAQIALDGGNPFAGPEPWYVKYKIPIIISSCATVAVIVAVALMLSLPKPDIPELTGMSKATSLMQQSSTAKEGLSELQNLVDQHNADAVYLFSRLCFSGNINEYEPDSIRNMRQVLLDSKLLATDNNKAHDLLQETVKLNPKDYHALFELGRDCLAGLNRNHEKELASEDFQKANNYFSEALKFAEESGDKDYIERITEQLEMIKTVI